MVSWSATRGALPRRSALGKLASAIGTAVRKAYLGRAVLAAGMRLLTRFMLILAGLGLAIATAAVLWGLAGGLLVGAVSCFVLEWIVKDDAPATDRRAP
jgi:hypothetical protein